MALETCPECGGKWSTDSNTCPHCGHRRGCGDCYWYTLLEDDDSYCYKGHRDLHRCDDYDDYYDG